MPPFILATDAMASGALTRRELMRGYTKVYRNVYVPAGTQLTATDRAIGAWIASGRQSVLAGLSAAALLGSRWIPDDAPAELLGDRHRTPAGIIVHSGAVPDNEIVRRQGIRCTSAARTAFDLGRRLPFTDGVIRVDALLNATDVPVADIEKLARRYDGARNIRRLRRVLDLADGGAESPPETRVRVILINGGLSRPETQIAVGRRRIDMGWRQWKVGVEYDGVQHWQNPQQHGGDITRLEYFDDEGWRIVRVVAEHLRNPQGIVRRAEKALRAAGCPLNSL